MTYLHNSIPRRKETNITKKNPQREESWLSVLGVDKVSTELPDISSLNLNDEEQFVHIGNFEGVVEKLGR